MMFSQLRLFFRLLGKLGACKKVLRVMASLALLMLVGPMAHAEDGVVKPGDRVLLLGNTFLEREGNYGYLETLWQQTLGTQELEVVNLAWAADTVYGTSRSYFGPPQEGFDRLKVQVEKIQPSVVVLQYGALQAFEGAEPMADFLKQYQALLRMLKEVCAQEPRFFVLSALPLENRGQPFPSYEEENTRLAECAKALKSFAKQEGATYVPFFERVSKGWPATEGELLTTNGVHLGASGYARVAPLFLRAFGYEKLPQSISEDLRAKVIEKNELTFFRWRPANETYLNGFRKHEQGQNAAELVMFDPKIAQANQEILTLKSKAK